MRRAATPARPPVPAPGSGAAPEPRSPEPHAPEHRALVRDALPLLVQRDLARRWFEAPAPKLRRLYDSRRDAASRADARVSMWVAVLIYVAFAALDALLIPDVALRTTLARLVFGLGALALVEALARRRVRAGLMEAACAAVVVACYLAWLVLAAQSVFLSSVGYYMIFGTIFIMVACLFFDFKPIASTLASGVILLAFFAVMHAALPATTSYKIAFGTFYICCFAFNAYVNWKLNTERYNVFLNALQAEFRQDEVTARSRDLFRLSHTDPLTGLANRRAVDAKLRSLWSEWLTDDAAFGVVLIDIDFFKSFNDAHGHQEGDSCLVRIGEALTAALRPFNATIGRYGGEEFIVLLKAATPPEMLRVGEVIRACVADLLIVHHQRRDGESHVTASVGAAFTRSEGARKLERLVNEADRALYGAKASGRNCVRLFDPADPHNSDESENIAALLRIALERNLVSLVYQPIQGIASGRMEAVEALMRLKMLDGTNVPPSLFIPIAERTGAIAELGRFAIRTACRELLTDSRVPLVSVNISAEQLRAPGFTASVAAILGETGVHGSRLAFEITEGLELEQHSGMLRSIAELKQLGIRIWLDDFGTGFAGLSWLRLVEFDTVKIDRSFLADSNTEAGAAMLRDIIALIRNRGHKILVEGVEAHAQLALMREFRIDQVQGYFIGRPAPAEALLAPDRAVARTA